MRCLEHVVFVRLEASMFRPLTLGKIERVRINKVKRLKKIKVGRHIYYTYERGKKTRYLKYESRERLEISWV